MLTAELFAFMGLGGLELMLILGSMLVLFGGTALWIWALVDIARSDFRTETHKITWVVLVALTYFIGALIYLFIGRAQRAGLS